MKDEIKEILDELESLFEISEAPEHITNGFNKIKDYITNLQEKYDIAQKDIEAMKNNYNLLVRLIENGESMTQKFENGLTYQDYKSRNEKAIEFIKENACYNGNSCCDDLNYYDCDELMKILNGGDE